MNYYKQMDDYIIKRFENPDEVREFDKGKYEVVNLPHIEMRKIMGINKNFLII